MMTRRESLRSLGTVGVLGLASIPLAPENLSIAAVRPPPSTWTPLSFLVDATDPSFGTVDTPQNTTRCFQNAIDYCFGSVQNPHGSNGATTNKVLMIPPGYFQTTAPLQIKYLHGGKIVGAGRDATVIRNISGGHVIATNGCGYSHFEGMLLQTTGDENSDIACFNLDWDGSAGGPALQSNTFSDMHFAGGAYGLYIGASGFMGSENLITNCYFVANSYAGIVTANFNALQQTVIGGNIRSCKYGIAVWSGSAPTVHGVGFQANTEADIYILNSAFDTYSIAGCRSESVNFLYNAQFRASVHLDSCNHKGPLAGTFAYSNGPLHLTACRSLNGTVQPNYAQITVDTCFFQRPDWLGPLPGAGAVEVRNSRFGPDSGTPEYVHARRINLAGSFDYIVTPVL